MFEIRDHNFASWKGLCLRSGQCRASSAGGRARALDSCALSAEAVERVADVSASARARHTVQREKRAVLLCWPVPRTAQARGPRCGAARACAARQRVPGGADARHKHERARQARQTAQRACTASAHCVRRAAGRRAGSRLCREPVRTESGLGTAVHESKNFRGAAADVSQGYGGLRRRQGCVEAARQKQRRASGEGWPLRAQRADSGCSVREPCLYS